MQSEIIAHHETRRHNAFEDTLFDHYILVSNLCQQQNYIKHRTLSFQFYFRNMATHFIFLLIDKMFSKINSYNSIFSLNTNEKGWTVYLWPRKCFARVYFHQIFEIEPFIIYIVFYIRFNLCLKHNSSKLLLWKIKKLSIVVIKKNTSFFFGFINIFCVRTQIHTDAHTSCR